MNAGLFSCLHLAEKSLTARNTLVYYYRKRQEH